MKHEDPTGAADWIRSACSKGDSVVGTFVPSVFPSLLKVLHSLSVPRTTARELALAPLLPDDGRSRAVRVRWADLLAEVGGGVTGKQMLSAAREIPESSYPVAWMGPSEVAVLVDHVDGLTPVSLFWDQVSSGARGWQEHLLTGPAFEWRRFVAEHDGKEDGVLSPTYVWPDGREWLLWTSPDLPYSVLGSDGRLAELVLSDRRLEAVLTERHAAL